MFRIPCLSAGLLVTLAVASVAGQNQQKNQNKPDQPKKPPAIRALMIAGGCCHDYPNQIRILTEGISQRAHVEWEIFHGLSPRDRKLAIYQTDDWTEGYDIIVHNECYGGVVEAEYVQRIVRGHTKHKVPMVAIHCAMHSYRNAPTDDWRKLLGVTSKRHEKHYALEVVNRAHDHPIMKDFGSSWATPNGELYVIEKSWPNCTPLATAFAKGLQADQPVIWTNEYEGVKVFGTTLGHHNETMLCNEYLDVVARGVLWACEKLDDEGNPESGYEGSGKSEILLPSMLIERMNAPGPTPAKK